MNPSPDLIDHLAVSVRWLAAGFTAAVAGAAFGSYTVLVCLLILMAIDWVTGFNRAYIDGELSSEAGAKGLAKKGQILLLILAIHVMERMSGYELGLELWGAGGFCINEAISIIENVSRSGVGIPKVIVDGLLRVKSLSPRPATRAELDLLKDEVRATTDATVTEHRKETDAIIAVVREKADTASPPRVAPVVMGGRPVDDGQ